MIALIAAYDRNRVIGYKGRIPWKIRGEQKRFRDLTAGNAVVMGRRTYEEIGKPLPERLNIVVSSTKSFCGEDLITAGSLQDAIDMAGDRDVFISGGAALYREALPLADILYITEIDAEFEGDTFFPEFEKEDFILVSEEHTEGEIPYTYLTYTRK